jgi:hypothetical protein
VQAGVGAAQRHHVALAAFLDELALVEDRDAVGAAPR